MGTHRKTLLWKILGEGAKTPSFLFGSMHVRNRYLIEKCKSLIPYIARCEIFASEMDIQDLQGVSFNELLDPQENLRKYISRKKFDKLRNILIKAFGLDIAHYDQMPPMMTLQLITESLLTIDTKNSLDEFLWDSAKQMNLKCKGVETLQDQLKIMRSIPWSYQVYALVSVGKNVKKFRKEVLKTVNYYIQEDIDSLFQKTKKQLGEIRKLMLYNRNQRMSATIASLCEQNASFIAIGAAHLSGSKGVLRLLKRHGFRVSPVDDWSSIEKEKSANTSIQV